MVHGAVLRYSHTFDAASFQQTARLLGAAQTLSCSSHGAVGKSLSLSVTWLDARDGGARIALSAHCAINLYTTCDREIEVCI